MPNNYLPLVTDITHQGHLLQIVQELFPHENIVHTTRKKAQISDPSTGHLFEIDIWIPSLQLGFEFQDVYHYMSTWYYQQSLDIVQRRDASKRDAAKMAEMALIQVPCWWDGVSNSLVATISFQRPELFLGPTTSQPIPQNPPPDFFSKQGEDVPEIGTLMLASFPLNQNHFNQSIGIQSWWMGEKFDGVRCCWDPEKRVAYSRSGKEIPLHDAIAGSLPNIYIDGELWFGRGMFSLIYSLLHGDSSWPGLRMVSFDSPHQALHLLPFEQRYKFLLRSAPDLHPISIVAHRMLCEGANHLNSLIGLVIDGGGEGMILRRVGSHYEQGRSKNLIKFKTAYGDTEGLVVAVDPQAVSLKLPTGQVFKVPMTHVHVFSPSLQIGEIVTFSYEKLARRDIPVNAEIFRRRSELKWEDVLSSHRPNHIQASEESENFVAQPRGFWTFGNMREFLTNFAKKLNLDPFLPSTWITFPFKLLSETKGGRAILQKFKDPFIALTSLFPDIRFQNADKFKKSSPQDWDTPEKRRSFFVKFAKENNFDYLSPDAWYSHYKNILSVKGAKRVIRHHKGTVWTALLDLFPDIGVEKSKQALQKWHATASGRLVLEKFARKNGFDPLSLEAWHSQSRSKILSQEGARDVLRFHGGVSKALRELFPEIGIKSKARFNSYAPWVSPAKRKKFFEKYARDRGFDPLSPDAWYTQSKKSILSAKGASSVLRYHNGSISRALSNLFPNIGIEKARFISKKWFKKEDRRIVLEKYARESGFDYRDPDAWRARTYADILYYLSSKGAKGLLHQYNGNISKALSDLFPEIDFEKTRKEKWSDVHRREYFEHYELATGIDYLQMRESNALYPMLPK